MKQQGFYKEVGALASAHSFPIKFPSACYGIVATHNPRPHTESKYMAWATNNIGGTVYLDKFLCGLNDDLTTGDSNTIFIVAIGK